MLIRRVRGMHQLSWTASGVDVIAILLLYSCERCGPHEEYSTKAETKARTTSRSHQDSYQGSEGIDFSIWSLRNLEDTDIFMTTEITEILFYQASSSEKVFKQLRARYSTVDRRRAERPKGDKTPRCSHHTPTYCTCGGVQSATA